MKKVFERTPMSSLMHSFQHSLNIRQAQDVPKDAFHAGEHSIKDRLTSHNSRHTWSLLIILPIDEKGVRAHTYVISQALISPQSEH